VLVGYFGVGSNLGEPGERGTLDAPAPLLGPLSSNVRPQDEPYPYSEIKKST
jgi:hypothetical protein